MADETTRARPAIELSLRSVAVLSAASVAGLIMLLWPLFFAPAADQQRVDQPFIFIVLLPVVVLVVLAEISQGGMDSKALAMLGVLTAITAALQQLGRNGVPVYVYYKAGSTPVVLSEILSVLTAINAALRPIGAGTAGIEMVFFMLILGGRVFGPGFGFVLGCTSLFASALLTAGVGPWLPFQMLCSAWIGMFAGFLPKRVTGKAEIAMLVAYGIVGLGHWPRHYEHGHDLVAGPCSLGHLASCGSPSQIFASRNQRQRGRNS